MTFYSLFLHTHSGFRYVALALLLITVVKSLVGVSQHQKFSKADQKLALFTMIAFHLQFLIGFILYTISPKVLFQKAMFHQDMFRFFTLEHSSMMIVAMILITIGFRKAKKSLNEKAHLNVLIFYSISLLLVLLSIPWPFRIALGGSWM